MNEHQWRALERYVRAGGNLIIEGTAQLDGARAVRRYLDPVVPVTLDDIRAVPRPVQLRDQKPYAVGIVQDTAPPFIASRLPRAKQNLLTTTYGWSAYQGTHFWLARGVLGRGRVTYIGACVANKAFGYTRDANGRPHQSVVDVASFLLHYDWYPTWRPLRGNR